MSKINLKKPVSSATDEALSILFQNNQNKPPTAEVNGITRIPLDQLKGYRDEHGKAQHYRPYTPDQLQDLAESIQQLGILSPIVVRPKHGGYEILAGHNRTEAARLAGLEEVPCIIREADDPVAKLIVNTSNLNQRQELSFSEKAWGYRNAIEAIVAMGAQKGKTVAVLSETNGENRRQIQRYIRLTYLIDEFLAQVDRNELPFRVGVNLSFLTRDQQELLHEYCYDYQIIASLVQSEKLKQAAESGDFSVESIDNIMQKKQPAFNLFNVFANAVKDVMPKSANEGDVKAIVLLIQQYFEGKEEVI